MPLLKSQANFLMSGVDGLTANGVSTPWRVSAYEDVLLQITSTGNGACTLKVQGSLTNATPAGLPPDFSAAKSSTNQWTYLPTLDIENVPESGNIVRGLTGRVLAGNDSDNTFSLYVTTASMGWLSVEVSNYTAGAIIVRGQAFGT